MKAIIVLKKKKEKEEITRRMIEKLEMAVEEINDVERANFDMTTFKLYVEIEDDTDDPPGHSDFFQVIQKGNIFRVVSIGIC